MNCPTCPDSTLVMADRAGIEIDYCPTCRGVWLDRGELDKIIDRSTGAATTAAMPVASSSTYHSKYHAPQGQYPRKKKSFLGDLFDF